MGAHIASPTSTSQSSFLFFSAYSKIVTLGKDEFHLHLVDTAGQVPVWGRVSKPGSSVVGDEIWLPLWLICKVVLKEKLFSRG